jgi:hypothetical protein
MVMVRLSQRLIKQLALSWTTEDSEFESVYGQELYFLHIFLNSSGAHPAPYTMRTRGFFPQVKLQERETDNSPPTSAEVKKTSIYLSTRSYVFLALCLAKQRDSFTFTISVEVWRVEVKVHATSGMYHSVRVG